MDMEIDSPRPPSPVASPTAPSSSTSVILGVSSRPSDTAATEPSSQSSESTQPSSQPTSTSTQFTVPSQPSPTQPQPLTRPSPPPSQSSATQSTEHPPSQSSAPSAPTPQMGTCTTDPDGDAIQTDPPVPVANGHSESPAPANGSVPNGTHRETETQADDNSSPSSSGVSVAPSVSATTDAQPETAEDDDLDRFLRRMDTEKKIAQLQQRLELASFKTNHGWSDMSINEIETRLPLTEQRRPQVVNAGGRGVTYEPPSPNRPWQLADSLWQNLPKPGRNGVSPHHPPPASANNFHRRPYGTHAPSHSLPGGLPSLASLQMPGAPRGPPPASPRRHRMDDYLSRPTVLPMPPPRHGHTQSHSAKHHANGHRNGASSGHRRSSSSITGMPFLSNDPYPASPLRPKKAKKRSQSHSNLRENPTTQDVDAARALTFMLESGRSPRASSHERLPSMSDLPPPPGHGPGGPRLPPLQPNASFPPPFASEMLPPRPRAQSFAAEPREPRDHVRTLPGLPPMGPPGLRTPSSHTRNRGTSMDSSAAFRGGFWQTHSNGKSLGGGRGSVGPVPRDLDREREQRERDRQRERERERNDRMMDERYEEAIASRPEDDQTAAELMMFLAHSPSPVRKRSSADVQAGSFSATARVLFSESDGRDRDRERERMREPAPGPRPGPPSLPAPRLR